MAVVMVVMTAETLAQMVAQRGSSLAEQNCRLSGHGKGDDGSECKRRTSPGGRTIEFAG